MDYTLFTAGTPNGQKISIALEELGAFYEVKKSTSWLASSVSHGMKRLIPMGGYLR